ncbi:hypothetical protein M2323_000213 [Rhodoblastus acidophilus]|nr:hypothetical protein [Rhodoblastus acidophilus]MCW2282280.1 hypothetical protein [Rhodoblastus acidophilus]MCW2331315.1 hypothetical protein [Rhodoblastus acidophilus]
MEKRQSPGDGFDWQKPHHSPLFWIGVALFLAALAVYLWSQDLSTVPQV